MSPNLHPGRLPRQIYDFYRANGTEELKYTDIMAKFGVTYRTAWKAVERLRELEVVETTHVVRLKVKRSEVAA